MSTAIIQLRTTFEHLLPSLSEEAWDFLQSGCSRQSLGRKDFFLRDGQRQAALGFVESGLLRGYYLNDKGEEVTIRFVREHGFVTDYAALINDQPSRYYFQCLEDCNLILLPIERVRAGYDQFPDIERLGRLIAEQILTAQAHRIEEFQFLTAEERYRNFIERSPELFNRVSLSHLASYLGIQRPSLSRIRQKIARKG